jgi:2-methylcitrate dehydratase PrpD
MKRVANELAGWASTVRWETLPPRIQEFARLVWLDTFGCMLLGASHPETIDLAKTLAARNPEGRTASAVGPSPRLTPLDAILVNGVSTGVDVFDGGNLDSKGHVAGYVMPGILTAAEQTGATLAETLAAFVVAYEVACRIGA